MKKFIIYLTVFLFGVIVGLSIYNPCDTNRDGKVTAGDYVKVKNYILKMGDDK